MGIFSSLGKTVAKLTVEPLAKITASVINKVAGTNIKPLTTEQAANTSFGKVYFPVLGAASTIAAASAVKAVGGISTVAKALVPKSTAGKIVAVVATPLITPTIISHPSKTIDIIGNTGAGLINQGTNINKFVSDPSPAKALDIIKENPILAGIETAGIALVGAKYILPAVSSYTTSQNTEAIKELPTANILPSSPQVIQIEQIPTPTAVVAPISPKVEEAPAVGKKPKKKKKAKAKPKKKKKKTKKKTRRSKKKKSKNIKRRKS